MKKIFCLICSLLLALSASAGSKIAASITVTNITTNGMVFTYNGDTRTFTTNVFNTASQVLTNADVTGNGSKTNLLNQIRSTPFSQTFTLDTGSNSFNVIGNADLAVALTVSPGYASVSYSTQTVSDMIALQGPVAGLPTAVARTNVASDIIGAAAAPENTNSIPYNSKAASELVGTNGTQTIPGVKTFSSSSSLWNGFVSQLANAANVLRGGQWSNAIMDHVISTNLVNYGDPFSSRGAGISSEQFGQSANANGNEDVSIGKNASTFGLQSIAIGSSASATVDGGMAIGGLSSANQVNAMALGYSSSATSGGATALGFTAAASGSNSTAMGYAASASFDNSTAIGANSTSTTSNQVMLGAPGISTVVQNDLTVQSSLIIGGTVSITGNTAIGGNASITGNFGVGGSISNLNTIGPITVPANSDISFARKSVSSLANGGNASVSIGTNMFIEVSGPSSAFSINGIDNGRDGKLITILNQTGFQMTIANESGIEPSAFKRIRTLGSATDLVLTNAECTFIYSGSAARWILVSHNP